ncbi:MAG: DNA cytosine methyltransferase [Candidatus Rokubacteria bacterium]|nr:DNA cytosine methyltransferase [Candidatus Rokubacteria bacterium]
MQARTLVIVLILVLLGAFAWLNWATFTTPTPLHLLVTRMEAPLGLLMLGVVATLTLLYFLFAVGLETTALLEARRHARELEAQRKLAEDAEASRYTELRRFLDAELAALRAAPTEAGREVIARLERLEEALKAEVERAGNTLAAYIGELEDRLTRDSAPPPGDRGTQRAGQPADGRTQP